MSIGLLPGEGGKRGLITNLFRSLITCIACLEQKSNQLPRNRLVRLHSSRNYSNYYHYSLNCVSCTLVSKRQSISALNPTFQLTHVPIVYAYSLRPCREFWPPKLTVVMRILRLLLSFPLLLVGNLTLNPEVRVSFSLHVGRV